MGNIGRLLRMPIDRDPPSPPPIIILPPAADTSPAPGAATDKGNAEADATAAAAKKKQKGATGMSADKMTGSQGLGEVPAANQERKTLLGY